jgi:hypothetical protein
MKLLTYLFYNLYSWYYKDGNYKRSITPWFQAVSGLAVGCMGWFFLLSAVYYHYVLNSYQIKIPNVVFFLIALFFFTIFYSLFAKDKKYERIYAEYKYFDEKGKTKGRFIAIMFMVFPWLLSMILSLIWHKMT